MEENSSGKGVQILYLNSKTDRCTTCSSLKVLLCPGRGRSDDCPYSEILDRQDDFFHKGFADWCATHDGALPRRDGSTSEERSLASWFRHKLRLYYSDDLSDDDIVKLKKIPAISDLFSFQGRSLCFALLACKYFEDWFSAESGTLPLRCGKTKKSLAKWLINKMSTYQTCKLPENHLAKLQKVPAISKLFDLQRESLKQSEDVFDFIYKNLEEWCAAHNGTLPKRNGETQEERSLAMWLKRKWFNYRRGKLTDEQFSKLKTIPAISKFLSVHGTPLSHSERFHLKCKKLEDWCAAHNGTLPKKNGETQEERSLAKWLKSKRFNYMHGKLPDEQFAKLNAIPAVSKSFSTQGPDLRNSKRFHLKCKNLEAWCAVGSLPKQKGASKEERSLAAWLALKLHLYRHGKLPEEQLAELRKLPLVSKVFSGAKQSEQDFHLSCKSLEDWCTAHGQVPRRNGESAEERTLAIWLKNKLSSYRRGKLNGAQLAALRKIPVISEVFNRPPLVRLEHFELRCERFEAWCAAHNGTLPRRRGLIGEERSLATWLKDKLYNYHRGTLKEKQVARLRRIPAISGVFGGKTLQAEGVD